MLKYVVGAGETGGRVKSKTGGRRKETFGRGSQGSTGGGKETAGRRGIG